MQEEAAHKMHILTGQSQDLEKEYLRLTGVRVIYYFKKIFILKINNFLFCYCLIAPRCFYDPTGKCIKKIAQLCAQQVFENQRLQIHLRST